MSPSEPQSRLLDRTPSIFSTSRDGSCDLHNREPGGISISYPNAMTESSVVGAGYVVLQLYAEYSVQLYAEYSGVMSVRM